MGAPGRSDAEAGNATPLHANATLENSIELIYIVSLHRQVALLSLCNSLNKSLLNQSEEKQVSNLPNRLTN